MNYKSILIFDISGEYGHFRKFNTTTSPLTYSIPTRTAIVGIIGAVLGWERELDAGIYPKGVEPIQENLGKQFANIAIQLINPVKTTRIAFNLIDTDKSFSTFFNKTRPTQIEFELIKDVKFRIFVSIADKTIFKNLIDCIKNRNHHFSPYMGLSQFMAFIEYIDLVNGEMIQLNDFIEIISAINLSIIQDDSAIRFDYQNAKYSANIMPVEMDRNRIVQEFSDVLIETEGKPIKVKVKEYYYLKNYGKVLFL